MSDYEIIAAESGKGIKKALRIFGELLLLLKRSNYFLFSKCFLYLVLNLSTRPAVSTSCILPV